ncbi:hypothetical protein AAE250_05600 [Bacteroides sp. GD17]|jgi:hypothetical protein|uniref:hypothetical protein n=1 Tax=Bacteroides sp. GD17 TaxID=3139826 RepID=UPI00313EC661
MKNVILVFRTSVSTIKDVERVSVILNKCPQIMTWNIDLEDWEKVLRIECRENLKATDISIMLKDIDICISELE